MIPLTIPEVLWLLCVPEEIEKIVRLDGVLKLGGIEDVKPLLAGLVTPQNLLLMQPLMRQEKTPANFIMLQGRIIGLIPRAKT